MLHKIFVILASKIESNIEYISSLFVYCLVSVNNIIFKYEEN